MLCIANKIYVSPRKLRKPPRPQYIFDRLDRFLWKIKKTLWKSYFDFSPLSAMM